MAGTVRRHIPLDTRDPPGAILHFFVGGDSFDYNGYFSELSSTTNWAVIFFFFFNAYYCSSQISISHLYLVYLSSLLKNYVDTFPFLLYDMNIPGQLMMIIF